MRTVRQLKEELTKFPDDALCHAYEGEAVGIAITHHGAHGFIPCSGGEDSGKQTELLR